MSIKVVVSNSIYSLIPNSVVDKILNNPILAVFKPLPHHMGFGDIPRHHSELVKIIEEYWAADPKYANWKVESGEGNHYLIVSDKGIETIYFEKDMVLVDISMESSDVTAPNTYSDYLTPDWEQTVPVTWKRFIVDPVQEIWHTFTSQQKLVLAKCAAKECQEFFDSM